MNRGIEDTTHVSGTVVLFMHSQFEFVGNVRPFTHFPLYVSTSLIRVFGFVGLDLRQYLPFYSDQYICNILSTIKAVNENAQKHP